jgi:hypothetical protein
MTDWRRGIEACGRFTCPTRWQDPRRVQLAESAKARWRIDYLTFTQGMESMQRRQPNPGKR